MALMNWATNVLQWKLQKEAIVFKLEQISKSFLSSDCGLKLAHMKLESLVIVDQHATVNLYLSLVHTARHTLKIFMPWSKRSSPRTHSAIKKNIFPFFSVSLLEPFLELGRWLEWSRNKVAVGEPVAGETPFFKNWTWMFENFMSLILAQNER